MPLDDSAKATGQPSGRRHDHGELTRARYREGVSTSGSRPRSRRPSLEDASAVSTVRGIPSWGAILVAVGLTAVGAAIDGLVTDPTALAWGFRLGFVAGVGLAALLVRRGSIFTAMVQPPLVLVAVGFISLRLMSGEKTTITLIKVINSFPTMVIGTALAVLLCVIRILAQPLRKSRPASPQRAHV